MGIDLFFRKKMQSADHDRTFAANPFNQHQDCVSGELTTMNHPDRQAAKNRVSPAFCVAWMHAVNGGIAASPTWHQQGGFLQSSAFFSTFSPTFCTSLPAPAIVLHALKRLIENIDTIIRAIKRFMGFSSALSDWHWSDWGRQQTSVTRP
jgi:hypothetical protein